MPLSIVGSNEERYIKKIGGNAETKRFLEGLGFTVGSMVRIVSVMGGSLIVQILEARVAISREMANKIMV